MTASSVPPEFRGIFRADDEARAVYAEAAGIARIWPRAIAVPADVDDLRVLVRWALANRTPLIPRGSGSSMPSGAIGDGVIVDLSRWTQLDSVNTAARTIRVGPGVRRAEVDGAARTCGLRFPVDPSSGAFCTVGGMASTNAAGSHSMHFGAMRPWVHALDCVFADGARAEVRRGAPPPHGIPAIDRLLALHFDPSSHDHAGVVKDSSGYATALFARSGDLVDLLVGSEGTLVLFVALELSLTPVAAATSSVFGAFASLEAAVDAAVKARSSGAVACELLDRTFLEIAASSGSAQLAPDCEAALLAEVEGTSASDAARGARLIEDVFTAAGAMEVRVALDAHTETELWELRHAASPILARLDPRLRSMQFVEDCAVSPTTLPAYVRGVREILARHETRGVIFGHAGDAHVHVNPLIDTGQPDWRSRVDNILDEVVSLAASLGGTLTGEHGDGRLRTPLLARVWSPEALAGFREVKAAFDPAGILNPGVKVPTADQRALGAIKYDPDLAPLPRKAVAALAQIDRDRAYASFRLALLADAK